MRLDEQKPAGPTPKAGDGAIPMRPFGKAKVQVSALGLGGHHLGEAASVEEAIRIVRGAIDGGITFFDNCWEYYNGRSENWLGRALAGKRDDVFLMTKVCTHGRGKELARTMLEESLRRLGTDHLDLWQIHAVSYDNDPDLAYAKNGVIEALEEAKKAGKTRFVGFTGHKDPHLHLKMLRMGYPFDSVQMPLNPFDSGFVHSFERLVLPELHTRGIAPLGMKALGGTADAIKKGVLTGEEALRYAMSLPVAVTICGMETVEVLNRNLKIARGFQPLGAEAMDAIRKKCAALATDGRYEPYKVSLKYDNPETRLPHGFPVEPQNKEMKEMFKEAGAALKD
jgi:aryl-alcohol dehydrogenase-like predicted oxidoreductase